MVVLVLEGHFAATRGGIYIDFGRMNYILKLNKDDMDVVVQPAVGWELLNDQNIVTATFASNGSSMRANKLNTYGREEVTPTGVYMSVDFESIDLRAPWRGYGRK